MSNEPFFLPSLVASGSSAVVHVRFPANSDRSQLSKLQARVIPPYATQSRHGRVAYAGPTQAESEQLYKALVLKFRGNEAFKQPNYAAAKRLYSQALALVPRALGKDDAGIHVAVVNILSNRARCSAHLGQPQQVIDDCTEVLGTSLPNSADGEYAIRCLEARARAFQTLDRLGDALRDWEMIEKALTSRYAVEYKKQNHKALLEESLRKIPELNNLLSPVVESVVTLWQDVTASVGRLPVLFEHSMVLFNIPKAPTADHADPQPAGTSTEAAVSALVVVFGGRGSLGPFFPLHGDAQPFYNDVWTLQLSAENMGEPAHSAWRKVQCSGAAVPPRHSHLACVHNQYMYIFGGEGSGDEKADDALREMYRLNLNTFVWEHVPCARKPPNICDSSVQIYDGCMYVVGGRAAWPNEVDIAPEDRHFFSAACSDATKNLHMWRFEFASGQWFREIDMRDAPLNCFNHVTFVHGERLFVFGGRIESRDLYDNSYSSTLYAYTYATRSWEHVVTTGVKPAARGELCAVVHAHKHRANVYMFGGFAETSSGSKYFSEGLRLSFTGYTPRWFPLEISSSGMRPSGRAGYACVIDPARSCLVLAGGYNAFELPSPVKGDTWLLKVSKHKLVAQKCQHCGKSGKCSVCSSCKRVYYCTVACQKADWPAHKAHCKARQPDAN